MRVKEIIRQLETLELKIKEAEEKGAKLKSRIRLIQSCHKYGKGELEMLSKEQIKYAANMTLMNELEAMGVIEYKIDDLNNQVTAHLKVILP